MEWKTLGKTKEKLPAIGMGSWQMTGDESDEIAGMRKGLDMGARFIDTAEIYGTEPLAAKVLKGEKEVFVASKVWPNHFRYDDVIKACDGSLKRLGIKQLDLYQLHWPNYTVSIEETMAAMEDLQKDGKIRHIGVSNFSVKELQEAQACLSHSDIVSNQVEYSVIMREPEEDGLLDFCKKGKVTLIAYSPFGTGALFDSKRAPLVKELGSIGDKYEKSAVQVALNWLIAKEPVVAIPKASTVSHTQENISAIDFKLSKSDISRIDEVSKKYQKPSLAGGHIVRKLLKHTTFWHGIAAKRMGKGDKNK